jgi:hypothetical protein
MQWASNAIATQTVASPSELLLLWISPRRQPRHGLSFVAVLHLLLGIGMIGLGVALSRGKTGPPSTPEIPLRDSLLRVPRSEKPRRRAKARRGFCSCASEAGL